MPTYYEILNLPSTASKTEIEQALDSQYSKVRGLVTHHDPEVVTQANVGLQLLEKIRSTLTDAGRRSAYDAAVSGGVNGIADPTMSTLPSQPVTGPVLPGMAPPRHLPPTALPSRSWICPKCQSPNAVNSQFCRQCGEALAEQCPACEQLVEKGAEFCTHCGMNIPNAKQKKEWEGELQQTRLDLNATSRNVPILDPNLAQINKLAVSSSGWAILSLLASLVYFLARPGELPGIHPFELTSFDSGIKPFVLSAVYIVLVGVTLFFAILRRTLPSKAAGAILAGLLFVTLPKTVDSLVQSSAVALIITAVTYWIVLRHINTLAKADLAMLKIYHTSLPRAGCLGTLFSLALLALPLLYLYYVLLLIGGFTSEYNGFVNDYEFYVWLVNGLQLLILSGILGIYMLLGLRTSLRIETRFKQGVMDHSNRLATLSRQVRSLEQAISQINLRPNN